MSPDQAMAGLTAVVGGGGVSAIIVAIVGYLTEARKGRPAPAPIISVGDALEGARWDGIAATALTEIAGSVVRICAILELDAEGRYAGRDFHDRLDAKVINAHQREMRGHGGDGRGGG